MDKRATMKESKEKLSKMTTDEEKLAFLLETMMTLRASPKAGPPETMMTGRTQPPTKKTSKKDEKDVSSIVFDLAAEHNLTSQFTASLTERMLSGPLPGEDPWTGPVTFIPCANVDPDLHEKCPKVGTLACANCRLVLYYSQACQKTHWKRHKQDCKYHLNLKDWEPAWLREGRDPTFSMPQQSQSAFNLMSGHGAVGMGKRLWGNVPAIDLLNLKKNEGLNYMEDLSLCFAASGDLRNVLLTVNSIPLDYQGRLSIVMNDLEPRVALRNLLILLVLLEIEEKALATDVALHLWYSAFMPSEYEARILPAVNAGLKRIEDYLDATSSEPDITKNTRLELNWGHETHAELLSFIQQIEKKKPDIGIASNELLNVMFASHQIDYYDRYHCKLRPAHRIALREYRSFGLVLPFGAANAHFNTPNKTLFTETGQWIQNDMLYPIGGWDLAEVTSFGASRGATPQDIFGCLYFYLSDQLLKFKERLGALKITFHLADVNCRELASVIKASSLEAGTASTNHPAKKELPREFDRIDVSNTVDDNYVGLEQTLSAWSDLLKSQNPHSTLLAYSMNWIWEEPKGNPENDRKAFSRISGQLVQENRFDHVSRNNMLSQWSPLIMVIKDAVNAMYENSKSFQEYLKKRGVSGTATSQGLRLKAKHTIVPKRHFIPLDAPLSTLPSFANNEEWYEAICLSRHGFFTRFMEFSLA
ncbi:hypothetical protein M408DRAFT_330621 [Serendipita vermifera MAFF 305830]|uniref:MYND-type domain-containing protein n=1 Tax=Serendipita vermifera MAFF 305830 TaxID=933852 RepID=A0A0C2WJH0_SERVB|nr:hypothetical protein M408DRAFT_330621 [Serendipita vermifera MAFF 305830]